MPSPEEVAAPFVELVQSAVRTAEQVIFVALDGRSGAGKSTLASIAATILAERDVRVAVIEGDQFYAGGSAETWDTRSAEEKVANAMDWRRQRLLLTDLRSDAHGTWRSFDWEAPDWDVEPAPLEAAAQHLNIENVDVLLLEGAYSARPELHQTLDLRVLLDPPAHVRRQQLLAREGDLYRVEWEGRWSEAEDIYFDNIMTPGHFDLVITP